MARENALSEGEIKLRSAGATFSLAGWSVL
jgi:hypothetical protein